MLTNIFIFLILAEKPFISTVKSNTLFPHPAFIESVKGKCHGTAHLNKTSGIYKELEKLKSEIKYSEDVISILKKQVSLLLGVVLHRPSIYFIRHI